MILTLQVVGERAVGPGAVARKVFDSIGGTIGRLPDNDWVLPSPYVSGRHALIRYLNGRFFIEDMSTNGVYLNSRSNRLARDYPHPLSDGDRLYIDEFEIAVTITEDPARDDPFEALFGSVCSSPARRKPPGGHQP
ncbi:MAG TPA: FHA domain-containing protein [Steroidobacteraceae bacterium]|jgi:type VI secretion system FHA domain protein